MSTLSNWLKAFRLRTLPLALSSIGMGGFLAYFYGNFQLDIFMTCISTTLLLQILSNLANDYGDFKNGADLAGRIGPARTVQSGAITPETMKAAIFLFTLLSFLSGIYLLYISHLFESLNAFGFFLFLGIAAIAASIKYTAGNNPYGYAGLGDLSVFIFFGWVGVLGSFYLQTGFIPATIILPATSIGLLATGVLNINNMRDIESDSDAGKKTIPMRIGRAYASIYHLLLVLTAIACAILFTYVEFKSKEQWVFFVSVPFFIRNIVKVREVENVHLDPYLKQLAFSILLFVLSFGLGLILSKL